jgi:hypothetical protein
MSEFAAEEIQTPADPRRPFEEWVAAKKPAAWLAAAARAMQGWAIGREVTEHQFDKALEAAGAVTMR